MPAVKYNLGQLDPRTHGTWKSLGRWAKVEDVKGHNPQWMYIRWHWPTSLSDILFHPYLHGCTVKAAQSLKSILMSKTLRSTLDRFHVLFYITLLPKRRKRAWIFFFPFRVLQKEVVRSDHDLATKQNWKFKGSTQLSFVPIQRDMRYH